MNKKSKEMFLDLDTPYRKSISLRLKITMLLIGLFSIANIGIAQDKNISGVVSDSQGTLPGANVIIKGTTIGTSTDFDGNYTIGPVSEGDILEFSSMGATTQEVTITNQTTIDILLQDDVKALDEIVVMGYTTTTRKNVASSVSSLDTDEILGMATVDVQQSIQGKVSGVQVTSNGGEPGSGSKMVIRGMGSFSNTNPLYVIDGIQGGDINSIPQASIESITILKDAATTAIYGSAGANGVVIITTKNGKSGKVQVEYDGSVGIGTFTKRFDMLSTERYLALAADIQDTKHQPLTPKLEDGATLIAMPQTNWQDEVFRNAVMTDHSLRVSGGADGISYAFDTGYQKRESTVADRTFERLNIGLKLDEKLFNERLRLGQSIRIKSDRHTGVMASFINALRMPEYIPVKDASNLGGYGRTNPVEDINDANNPMNEVGNQEYNDNNFSMNIDLFGQVDIIEGLKFKTQARISYTSGNRNHFEYPSQKGNASVIDGRMSDHYFTWSQFFWENFFMYNKDFGDHSINATLGTTYAPASSYHGVTLAGTGFIDNSVHNIGLAETSQINGAGLNSGKARQSYFGSMGYIYKNRYVLSGSLRRDASSVFGENNKWGTFYGLGTAWTISEEEFMENSSISLLKLRASYGKTGNDNIPGNLTSSTVWTGWTNNVVYSFGDDDTFTKGGTVTYIPNPDLKWEETTQFDIGIDMGLIDDRLSFELDYYHRNNDDLLIQTSLPLSSGLGQPGANPTQWVNAASMVNYGVEFTAGYSNDRSNDFKWDISGNISYNHNEVVDLGTAGQSPISSGEFVQGVGFATRTDIGQPISSFYGYKMDRIVNTVDEIKALNEATKIATGGEVTKYQQGLKTGDYIWKDIDGNGYIDDRDRDFLGSPIPKFQYGATFNAAYKGFDFQIFFQGVAGVDIVNGGRYWTEGASQIFNATTAVEGRWTEEKFNNGEEITQTRAGRTSNLIFSDWYVESGDYLRLKNIALGYTFDKGLFSNTFNKFRIYGSIQNLYTFTNYSGYDPEIVSSVNGDPTASTFAKGIDYFNRPNPTMYRLGIQLNF